MPPGDSRPGVALDWSRTGFCPAESRDSGRSAKEGNPLARICQLLSSAKEHEYGGRGRGMPPLIGFQKCRLETERAHA